MTDLWMQKHVSTTIVFCLNLWETLFILRSTKELANIGCSIMVNSTFKSWMWLTLFYSSYALEYTKPPPSPLNSCGGIWRHSQAQNRFSIPGPVYNPQHIRDLSPGWVDPLAVVQEGSAWDSWRTHHTRLFQPTISVLLLSLLWRGAGLKQNWSYGINYVKKFS